METTKTCIKCNTTKDISQFTFRKDTQKYINSCRACENERKRKHKLDNLEHYKNIQKEYLIKNKDLLSEKKKKYYEENKEYILNKIKKHKENNRDKVLEAKRNSYYRHRESKLEKAKQYYDLNKEKIREYKKEYNRKQENKPLFRNARHRRRARLKDSDVTPSQIRALVKKSKNCYWCNVKLNKNYHIDHYTPISKGGKHTISNLVVSCPKCNLQKNAKDPFEFAQERGRLL